MSNRDKAANIVELQQQIYQPIVCANSYTFLIQRKGHFMFLWVFFLAEVTVSKIFNTNKRNQ